MSLISETVSAVISSQNLVTDLLKARLITADNVGADLAVVNHLVASSLEYQGTGVQVQSPTVAGGSLGDVVFSEDGVNFKTVSLPNTNPSSLFKGSVNGVAGDSQKWIATASKQGGLGATMGISYTGYTWTAHPSPPAGNNLFALAYHNNLWLSSSSTGLFYSLDGFTWVACSGSNVGGFVRALVYAQGRWVAVGSGVPSQAYSLDGVKWFPGSGLNFDFGGFAVAGNNNTQLFVAVGYSNGPNMLVSLDGETWSAATTPPPASTGYSVAVNSAGTMWVASGQGANFYYSTDGLVWVDSGFTDVGSAQLIWDGIKFVAVGDWMKDTAISYDGIHWSLIERYMAERATCINSNKKRGTLALL